MVTSIWSMGITPLSTPMMMRGKLVGGKHGDRKAEGLVDSHDRQRENQKDDRFRVARKPIAIRVVNRCEPSRRWRRLVGASINVSLWSSYHP